MNLVSIIVPCYNQGSYLAQNLESLLHQQYAHWECIIVDDGSTDITAAVASDFVARDARFKYIFQKNSGISTTRNTGLKAAKGDFIQLLDCDDLIEPAKLSSAIEFYKTIDPSQKIVVYSSMRYFENADQITLRIVGRDDQIAHVELEKSDALTSQLEVLKLRNPFVISAPVYPKNLFEEIGYFDESFTALEDWDFHFRCVKHGFRFHHCRLQNDRALIRLHDHSAMRNHQLLEQAFVALNAKHQLRATVPQDEPSKPNMVKILIKDLLPPIFFKLKNKLFPR